MLKKIEMKNHERVTGNFLKGRFLMLCLLLLINLLFLIFVLEKGMRIFYK